MQLTRSLSAHLIWRSLGLISNLMITVLLSRFLAAADSGQFFYFLSWLTLVILICSMGIEASITYFLASKKIAKKDLLPVALFWIFCVLILLGVIVLSIKNYYIQSLGSLSSGLYFVAGQLMISFFTAFYYGEQKFEFPAKIIFFSNLIYILLLIYANAYYHHLMSYELISDSYFFLVLFQGIWMMLIVVKDTGITSLKNKVEKGLLKTLFLYSLSAFGANILFFLATRIDYWLLHFYKQDAVSVGNYIQVSRLTQLFQIFPSMLAAFLFPSVAANKQQINIFIVKLSRIVLLIDLVLIMLIVISGSALFPYILGKSFDQMYELFLLLIPGIIALSLLAIISPYFSGNNRVIINLLVSVVGVICVLSGNWVLIPNWGVKAASVVSSISYLLCFLITWIIFLFQTKTHAIDFFSFRKSDFNFITVRFNKIFK